MKPLLFLLACLTAAAQTAPVDSKPASSNIMNSEYPRIDSDLRATFRLKAPEAQKVRPKERFC